MQQKVCNTQSGHISKHDFKMHKENNHRTKIETSQNHTPISKVNTTDKKVNKEIEFLPS